MLIKIFTLKFSDEIEGFDDKDLRSFMADRQIISVQERFFFRDNTPYWSLMLKYRPGSGKTNTEIKDYPPERKEDYRALLTDESRPLFKLLREWRNGRAKKDGMPPYILFTNKMLAEIASKVPENLSQLSETEGVGKAKLENYGKEIIEIAKPFVRQKKEKTEQPQNAEITEKKETGNKEIKEKPQSGGESRSETAAKKDVTLWESDQKKGEVHS